MNREVVITGIGPVCGLGLGIDDVWPALVAGTSSIAPMRGFDSASYGSPLVSELAEGFKVRNFVPKSYRKATKVMARDIELAVAAADLAAKDAGLTTAANNDGDAEPAYAAERIGCHIGAGQIAAEVNELTEALAQSAKDDGSFDINDWGSAGMQNLTPLWLLKYLPNMLACHVTIAHDLQGPSNTITCGEASGGLSLGESLRVIQRGQADACFCGGAESNLNPVCLIRQHYTERLVTEFDDASTAVRPYDNNAKGMAIGEGGGILILESAESYAARGGNNAYAKVVGFGASQSLEMLKGSMQPAESGRGPMLAIRAALRDAGLTPDDIDAVIPTGLGAPAWDTADANALRDVFGDRLGSIPVVSTKAVIGNCASGAGAIDLAIAAKSLREQQLPKIINRDSPTDGLGATQAKKLEKLLVFTSGLGGQNTAAILERV